MRYIIAYAFLLLASFSATAQADLGFYFQDIKEIPSDFETASKNFVVEKKETLHSLRVYIEAKESALDEIEKKISIVENDRSVNLIDTVFGDNYLKMVDSCHENMQVSDKIKRCLSNLGYMPQFYGDRKISDLDEVTERIRKKNTLVKKDNELLTILNVSKKNLGDDINKAQLGIDNLYSKLYDDGRFRLWITGIFSSIVGALLLLFFVFITRMSETNLAKDFLSSGNGLQFITLFSLIIAIILFGVLGVLEGRELAAILSGISGYILGKGIQNPVKDVAKGTTIASAVQEKGTDDVQK